jgi:RNA polymerase sigma-70 factor (ECF subfamily)
MPPQSAGVCRGVDGQRSRKESSATPDLHADEQDLMKAMADEDPSALAVLYDRHAATIFALCLRMLRDAEEAEEVLEDVFWQLWRRSRQYDASRGSVIAYLVMLARSRAKERARRSARRGQLRRVIPDAVVEEAFVGAASTGSTPLHEALARERRRQVRSALADLPDAQRVAIELSFLCGLSHPEISRRLGEPLGTVKTRIRAGLLRLREALVVLLGGGPP